MTTTQERADNEHALRKIFTLAEWHVMQLLRRQVKRYPHLRVIYHFIMTRSENFPVCKVLHLANPDRDMDEHSKAWFESSWADAVARRQAREAEALEGAGSELDASMWALMLATDHVVFNYLLQLLAL